MRKAKRGLAFRSLTFPLAALRGLGVGFVVIAIVFTVLSTLVSAGKLGVSAMPTATLGAAALGAVVGGIVGAAGHGARRLLTGVAVGGGMLIVCLVAAAFFEHATLFGAHHLMLTAAMVGGGAVGGLMLAMRR